MKRFKNIVILVLFWLLCGAPSCNDGGPQERLEDRLLSAKVDSIKKAFDIDIPGNRLLKSYEANAIQKLIDFADFLKIASDTSMEKNFRHQALEMAGKLFISTDIDTRNWSMTNHTNTMITLEQLLSKSQSLEMSYWLKPVNIEVNSPFRQENDSTFRGSLSFYLQPFAYDHPDQPGSNTTKRLIGVYALRKVKYFGEEQLKVWEVYLGDIK